MALAAAFVPEVFSTASAPALVAAARERENGRDGDGRHGDDDDHEAASAHGATVPARQGRSVRSAS